MAPTADRPSELAVAAEARRLRLRVRTASAPYELERAAAVAERLLRSNPPPTAAFCFSDTLAHGVYAAAARLRLPIPERLSVIGYDDQPVSALLSTPLTTFAWDVERVVAEAVDMVLGALEQRPVRRRVVVEPQLRERASTVRALAAAGPGRGARSGS